MNFFSKTFWKQYTHITIYVIGIVFVMGLCFSPISASAVLNDFLSGYAWSDAGGWSSFSCVNTDTCNTVNYKVEIDSNGDFSGYAWNDSYGWIFFGATTTCPSGVCQANVASGGTVSGWAKIISEGSNGWISLSGTSPDYGVTYDSITNELGGWAWSDAIGWISFNSTNCDPDGNGLSDSGIEGCPTGSADHWDEVNDDPLGAHDGDITSVYTSSETQQRDAYALEDTTQTGDINEVTIKSYTQGCAELWIIVDGVEYGLGGLACSGDTWGYNSGPTISTFEIPGGFTWDKINNMQVGVGLQQQTFFGTYDGKLTQIWVEVTYDEFEKLNLSPDGDGDYTEIDSPVGGDPPAVPDYAVVSDNSAPNAPTITGPTSGKINENYTFKFETSDFKILHEGAIFDDETTLLGYPRDVLVSGNYAYVANDNDVDKGVEIVDISNPSNPIHAASIPFVSGYGPVKIFLADDHLYTVSRSDNGIKVFDMLDPTAPGYLGMLSFAMFGDGPYINYPSGFVVSGNYAYIAFYSSTKNGVEVLNIEDPTNIYEAGSIYSSTVPSLFSSKDVYVAGNYAYVVSHSNGNFVVLDVFDPTNPQYVTKIADNTATLLYDPKSVFVEGNYAYVVSRIDEGLEIIDISDPTRPVHSGAVSFSKRASNVYVAGNYAYVTISDDDGHGLAVVNVSDPFNPVVSYIFDNDEMALFGANSAYVAGDYVYVSSSEGLNIFGIKKDMVRYGIDWDMDDEVDDWTGYDYADSFGSAVHLWDSPAIHEFQVLAEDDRGSRSGWTKYNFIIAANEAPTPPIITGPTSGLLSENYDFGFRSFDKVAVHVNDLEDNSAFALDGAMGIAVDESGNYAYVVGHHDWGFEVVDISEPSDPKHVNAIFDVNTALQEDVYVHGNYLYVYGYTFQIYDISIPSTPVYVGGKKDHLLTDDTKFYSPKGVAVSGNYAFVTGNKDNGLEVLSILDPENPIHETSLQDDASLELAGAYDIVISGDYAYITAFTDDGIQVVDISDPTDPIPVATLQHIEGTTALDGPGSIFIKDNYAYVVARSGFGLEIIDIEDPEDPTHAAAFFSEPEHPFGGSKNVFVDGNYAYITGGSGIEIVDVSDPRNPQHYAFISNNVVSELDGSYDVHVVGEYLLVSGFNDDGLEILKIKNDDVLFEVDWDNGSGIETIPSAGYVVSGVQENATMAWNSWGTKIISARAIDDEGLPSDWTTYDIVITENATPTATIILPEANEPDSEVLLRAGFADDNEGNPMYDECTIIRWYKGDDTCSDSNYLIHAVDPVNSEEDMEDVNTSKPYTYDFGAYGTYELYLIIKDSYGGWSDCEHRQVVIEPECSDGIDNNDNRDTSVEEPENWFDDGGGNIDDADPSCFDYASTTPPFDINNPFPHYLPSILYENNNPQCSDGIDNDGDGLIDEEDSGCHTNYIAASSTTYSKFLNQERTCGVDTNGIICDPDETFGSCPLDCAAQFQFIEF